MHQREPFILRLIAWYRVTCSLAFVEAKVSHSFACARV
jgi:hypothetical protein